MTRATLPTRRPSHIIAAEWSDGDQRLAMLVDAGFYDTGTLGETFVDVQGKAGKGMVQAIMADAAVLISLCLQHGVPLSTIGKSLAKAPVWRNVNGAMAKVDAPASPIGTVVEALGDVG